MAPGIRHPKRGEGLQLWLQGYSLKHIAEMLGVSDRSVRDWRDRDKWPARADDAVRPQRYSDSRQRAADAEFERVKDELAVVWEKSFQPKTIGRTQGVVMQGSAERVAEHFGWSPSKANKFLKRAGLMQGRPSNKTHGEQAVKLLEEGWSVPRIAAELGVSNDSVRNWLRARGVDLSGTPYTARMSHEEKMAWRRSISAGKTASVAGSGRYSYQGYRMDSSYEVRFATTCDRLGLHWRLYDRAADGVLEWEHEGGMMIVRYAPDFWVSDLPVEVKGIFDATAATKVKAFRQQKGKLAMIMKQELLDLEEARSSHDAWSTLQAACYLDPPTDPAYWD
jgi:transposase